MGNESAIHVRREARSAYLALTAAGIIWGAAFYFAKIAEPFLKVGEMMVLRFLFASLAFLPVLFRKMPAYSRKDWGLLLLAGGIGVPIQFLVQFEGLARTTVSHASLMIGTAPVLIVVAAWLFLRERPRPVAWIALGCSTVGVMLLLLPGNSLADAGAGQVTLHGDLLVLASMIGGVTWVLVSKQLMARHPSTQVSALTTLLGTAMLLLWVTPQEGLPNIHLPMKIWMVMAVLGVVTTTVTTLLWNYGLRQVSAGKAAIFINLEPVVGTILGVTLLGDSLGAFAVAGGLLIVAAAVVVSVSE